MGASYRYNCPTCNGYGFLFRPRTRGEIGGAVMCPTCTPSVEPYACGRATPHECKCGHHEAQRRGIARATDND